MIDVAEFALEELNRQLRAAKPALLAAIAKTQVKPGSEAKWQAVQDKLPALLDHLQFVWFNGELYLDIAPRYLPLWVDLTRGTSWHGAVDPDYLANLATGGAAFKP